MIDIILLGVLVVVSFGVFIWACIGLINPKWARFPNRASSVGVLVLAGMIFGSGSALALLFGSVFLHYFGLPLFAAARADALSGPSRLGGVRP